MGKSNRPGTYDEGEYVGGELAAPIDKWKQRAMLASKDAEEKESLYDKSGANDKDEALYDPKCHILKEPFNLTIIPNLDKDQED